MKNNICSLMVLIMLCAAAPSFAQEPNPSPGIQDKISIDTKGMDIVDVLKILATRSGTNIVVGKNVSGRVALFLKDVNIEEAFEIIAAAGDLAYERTGNVINVMTQTDYETKYGAKYLDKKQAKIMQLKYARAADISRSLNQMKSNVGKIVVDEGTNTLAIIDTADKLKQMEEFVAKTDLPLKTQVFELNYAQAEKLNSKLLGIVTKDVGYTRVDERTNKIVVTDYPEKLEEVAKLIEEFDERSEQVLIDAQIIEIKPSDSFNMGVDWDYWIKKNARLITSLPTPGASTALSIGTAAAGLDVTEPKQYKGIIDMLRTIGDTKILSSPRIMAINGQEARILVGTKQPYASQTTVTGDGGVVTTAETVNFVDVGIKLHVTPIINKEGFVTMKIRPEVSSTEAPLVTAKGEKIPVVDTSEAETSVMVKDGVTIIIGGLRKDDRQKTVQKLPVLGDIPFFGYLFRNTSDSYSKSELVILLTPHLLSGSNSYTENSQVTPTDGAVAKMISGDIISEKYNPADQKALQGYYKLLTDRISGSTFASQPKGKAGSVNISFELSSKGELISGPKVVSATDDELSSFAIKAIRDSSPFPAFPADFNKLGETFYITIDYK